MKRIISLSLVATIYAFTTFQSASAIFCSNCSTIFSQIPELANAIITSGSTAATQINTYMLSYKSSVLDPLANAMVAVSLLQQQKQTINLVTGALGGQQLLISNPQEWINNKGLNSVRISINDVSQQNGTYSDSILGSVIQSYRALSSLKGTLGNLSNSSIPSIVQNNICKDVALTNIARNDVMRSDGTYEASELQKRKQELYNSLCVGNPSVNIQLGNRLQQVSQQRPDVGGMDVFLATVSGDNANYRATQAQLAIAKEAEEKKKAAEADLARSGGVASPTKCTDTVQTAEGDVGNIANALCRSEVLTNTGSAVNSAYEQAINIPIQRLLGSFGNGILSTLGQLLSAKNTIGILADGFSSAEGSTNTSPPATSSGDAQDLLGNTEQKASLVKTIEAQLKVNSTSLDKLVAANQRLLSAANQTEASVASIGACYESVGYLPEDTSRPDYSYQSRKNREIASIRASVSRDETAISLARSLIAQIRTTIANSNSTTEINSAYTAFNDRMTSQEIPEATAAFTREAELARYNGENQQDNLEGGEAYNLRQDCETRKRMNNQYNQY